MSLYNNNPRSRIRLDLLLLVLLALSFDVPAQELEPRAFSPNPTGLNFLVLNYSRSDGSVLFDPSVPITDVEARLNSAAAGYGHTFGLFGRSATALFLMPYVWGDITGNVGEASAEITRSGIADASMQLSVNLLGGPALTPAEFSRRAPETTVGVSVRVDVPIGQYDASKLINIGTNRWAIRPQIGVSKPIAGFFVECYAGVWIYENNDDAYQGARQSQDPIYNIQLHASYTFKPRLWLALDATGYRGGQTTVNGVPKANLQENSRVGATLSLPVRALQSIKLSFSDGATTRAGASFRTVGIAWQYSWAD